MSYRNFVTLLSVLDQIYQEKLSHLEKKLSVIHHYSRAGRNKIVAKNL